MDLDNSPDHALPLHEKIELIAGIKYWQKERRKRLCAFLKLCDKMPETALVLAKLEIKLIREQAKRLEELWRSIINN